jgi:hypothetical protein
MMSFVSYMLEYRPERKSMSPMENFRIYDEDGMNIKMKCQNNPDICWYKNLSIINLFL